MRFFRATLNTISASLLLPLCFYLCFMPLTSTLFAATESNDVSKTLEQDVAEHIQAANSKNSDDSEGSKTSRFLDKWIINGNAIGNSIGAVIGQSLAMLAFGPAGLIVGSIVGSLMGGYIGNAIDDRTGIAINYTAFNRPPVTQGGIWLENVGPWEQFMYQFDAYVLNGGAIAGLSVNLLMNTMARTIPGLGMLANPILLALTMYFAGTVADNIDGMMDLGLIGRRIDEARGEDATVGTTDTDINEQDDNNDRDLTDIHEQHDTAYEEVLYHLQHGAKDSIKNAWEDFSAVKDSATEVIQSHFDKDETK